MNDKGTVRLETDRLVLRKIRKEDADTAFKNWTNDPKTTRYISWNPHGKVEVTRNLFEMWEKGYDNEYTYKWVVEVKDLNEVIGTIDVVKKDLLHKTCEIGYCYGSKFWGNGYGTEALKKVTEFLFNEVGFELIEIKHEEANVASGRVMQKAGYKFETKLRKRIIDKETKERVDLVIYSLTKEEYNKGE